MENNYNSDSTYKTIGEVAKAVGLIDKKNGNLQTHTIRYWETQFKQIKPRIKAGKRRCKDLVIPKDYLGHQKDSSEFIR